jgi:ABC-2 type transport system ATP-binding protein
MQPIIEVSALIKTFAGVVRAVDGIDFAVDASACFGLLGPNGAGKTTTVEIMEGITAPSAGQVLYKGQALGRLFKAEVGIQFQSTALQDFLTVRETLRLFRSFYAHGLDLDELMEMCALTGFAGRDNRKLSGGQRQRLLLAIALVNDPELIFLDEPTTGLDPQARRNFWALVENIKARRKTVILTTHYMEEAYLLCERIAIMDHGRIIAEGSPKALLAEHFNDVILQLPRSAFTVPAGALGMRIVETGDTVEIPTPDVNRTVRELLEHGVSLVGLSIRPRTLEDLFLDLTGEELRA